MFTVIAFTFTIFGVFLFCWRMPKAFGDWRWNHHFGGALLVMASILWVLVLLSLFIQLLSWLWRHAP